MDVFIKSIKKPLGLCPNINSLEILHTIHPKRLEVSTQSGGKDSGNFSGFTLRLVEQTP